jgi:hypothetical protein
MCYIAPSVSMIVNDWERTLDTVLTCFKVFQCMSGSTVENHGNSQSSWVVPEPKVELVTLRVPNSFANCTTVTFDFKFCVGKTTQKG